MKFRRGHPLLDRSRTAVAVVPILFLAAMLVVRVWHRGLYDSLAARGAYLDSVRSLLYLMSAGVCGLVSARLAGRRRTLEAMVYSLLGAGFLLVSLDGIAGAPRAIGRVVDGLPHMIGLYGTFAWCLAPRRIRTFRSVPSPIPEPRFLFYFLPVALVGSPPLGRFLRPGDGSVAELLMAVGLFILVVASGRAVAAGAGLPRSSPPRCPDPCGLS